MSTSTDLAVSRGQDGNQRLRPGKTPPAAAIDDVEPDDSPALPPRITTSEIMASPAPPHAWVVPDYLGNELTVLAGARNSGKSWLALDFAIAVAGGGKAMGAVACEAGDVLYVDLKNGPRHMQRRLVQSLPDPAELTRLSWITEAPDLADQAFVAILDEWRKQVPSPRLVVIDGARLAPAPSALGQSGHDLASQAIGRLRRWSNAQGIGVLLLYRTTGVGDPLVKAGEASRVLAAADTTLWLRRHADDGTLGTLRISGRSIEEMQWTLEFFGNEWQLLGEANDIAISIERQAIGRRLAFSSEPLSPSEIATATRLRVANVKKMLFRMLNAGEVDRPGRGLYARPHRPKRVTPVANVTNVTSARKARPNPFLEWMRESDVGDATEAAGEPS
jgi:hypothetical protein